MLSFFTLINGNMGVGVDIPQRRVHFKDVICLEPQAVAPSILQEGDMYYDDVAHVLKVYDDSTRQSCL